MNIHLEIVNYIKNNILKEIKQFEYKNENTVSELINNIEKEGIKVVKAKHIRKSEIEVDSYKEFVEYLLDNNIKTIFVVNKPPILEFELEEKTIRLVDILDNLIEYGNLSNLITDTINEEFYHIVNGLEDFILADINGVYLQDSRRDKIERLIIDSLYIYLNSVRNSIKQKMNEYELYWYNLAIKDGIETIRKILIADKEFHKCTNEKLRKAYIQSESFFDSLENKSHDDYTEDEKALYSVYYMLYEHREKEVGNSDVYYRHRDFISIYNGVFETTWRELKEKKIVR